MRVTIEHREEPGGVAGQRRDYFVDCTVAFSEEEGAIIKARGLYGHAITVNAATPLPSLTMMRAIGPIRGVAGLAAIAGVYIGLASPSQSGAAILPASSSSAALLSASMAG